MQLERFEFKSIMDILNQDNPALAVENLPPPPPTYSQEELDRAREEGFRKGFIDGEAEGRKQMESEQAHVNKLLTEMVDAFAAQLDALLKQYNQVVADKKAELPRLAVAAAKKVAGAALEANALPQLEATVVETVSRILGEPAITVTVNSQLAATLEKNLIERFANSQDPGEINILGDDNLPLGDCRIEWKHGNAEINTAKNWENIEQIAEDFTVVEKQAGAEQHEPPKEQE